MLSNLFRPAPIRGSLFYSELVPQRSPNTRSRSLEFSSTELSSLGETRPRPPASANHVRVWVQDEGIGIAREVHQKIFGIFERGVTSDLYPGTGIGLAIVARAMQRMGGTCGVGNRNSEKAAVSGSTFLPRDDCTKLGIVNCEVHPR